MAGGVHDLPSGAHFEAGLTAAAANQQVQSSAAFRIIGRFKPGKGGSGAEAERRNGRENEVAVVDLAGAGGHGLFSFLSVGSFGVAPGSSRRRHF
jgi:hypothetical protein